MYLNLDYLKIVYIIGGLMFVGFALLAYPTLSERAKQKYTKKK